MDTLVYLACGMALGMIAAAPMVVQLRGTAKSLAHGIAAMGFAFLLIGIALSTVQPLTGILMNAYSRKAEFRADKQAVKEGYGESLVTGLKLLAKENFAHLSPSPLLVALEYSHPPLAKRIERILEEVNK
jgi:STE24 endopeptidase